MKNVLEWLVDEQVPPQKFEADMLGEIPRGFFRSGQGIGCDDTSSAYVRGILLHTASYNALSFDQRFQLRQQDLYPRWRLYGGPFSLRYVAQQWDEYLNFWGFNNGQTWVSHSVVCIVPDGMLKWPADKSVRWDWVHEKSYPTVVSRHWDGNNYVFTYDTATV